MTRILDITYCITSSSFVIFHTFMENGCNWIIIFLDENLYLLSRYGGIKSHVTSTILLSVMKLGMWLWTFATCFSIVLWMHHHALWMLLMINKQYIWSVSHIQVVTLLYTHREVTWQKPTTQPPLEQAGMRASNVNVFFFRHFQTSELWMTLKAFHLDWGFLSSETQCHRAQS